MNKQWYSFGSPFKEKFRKHYCYKCGFPLVVIKHEKMVWQNTEEAKFYSFNAPSGHMVGPCEFIHDIFYCQRCPIVNRHRVQTRQSPIPPRECL